MSETPRRKRPALIDALFGVQASTAFVPQGQLGVWAIGEAWHSPGRVRASEVFGTAILVMIAAVVFRIVFHSLDGAQTWFVAAVPSAEARKASGIIAVLLFGGLLWMMRDRRRLLYALIEIGCAVAVAWTAVDRMSTDARSAWVGLLSAAYLVVRGLDNWQEGWARAMAKPEEPQPELAG